MRQLSNAARQAVFAQDTSQVFIMLLTITHPNFVEPIRLSSDPTTILPIAGFRGTISRGNEYVYMPFSVALPSQDDTGIARANISIDNIDRQIVMYIRQADSALSVNLEIVMASSPDSVEVSAPDFRLEKVSYDALTVSGDLSLEYYDLEPYSKLRFTPNAFTGMF